MESTKKKKNSNDLAKLLILFKKAIILAKEVRGMRREYCVDLVTS